MNLLYPIYLFFTVISIPLILLGLIISVLVYYPWLILNLFKGKKGKKIAKAYSTFYANFMARFLLAIVIPRIKIIGKKNISKKPERVCIVANHDGLVDAAFVQYAIPWLVGYVAKIEVINTPFIRQWLKICGSIGIDRSNPRAGVKSILKGVELVKTGESLLIFPEGTRSYGKGIREFKAGSFKLATSAKAIIVPITLEGTHTIFEQAPFAIRPFRKVTVTIHPPIDTAELTKEEEQLLPKKVWDIINSGLKNPGKDYLVAKKPDKTLM